MEGWNSFVSWGEPFINTAPVSGFQAKSLIMHKNYHSSIGIYYSSCKVENHLFHGGWGLVNTGPESCLYTNARFNTKFLSRQYSHTLVIMEGWNSFVSCGEPFINTATVSGLPAKLLVINKNLSQQFRHTLVIVDGWKSFVSWGTGVGTLVNTAPERGLPVKLFYLPLISY